MGKKGLALSLCAMLLVSAVFLGACGGSTSGGGTTGGDNATASGGALQPIAKEDLMVGFVYIGDIKDGGYNEGHDQGRLALEAMGIKCQYKENVPESSECETAIRELLDLGCNVIYTTSFGHMDWTEAVANEYPNVYFGHATGYKTTDNMCNYMGKIEQARYLTGIVAGLKTQSNKIGYVMAMPYAECIRGCNAFTLGVRSVNPEATVEIMLVNSWVDVATAKQSAIELLNKGCDVIAQHHDSTTPQLAAQDAGAFAIGYNVPTPNVAPNAYLTAAIFNWAKFYTDNVQSIIDGTWAPNAYWEGLDSGWVDIDPLTDLCPPEARELVETARQEILGGYNIFGGDVLNQNGEVGATDMTDDEIWNMEWLVQGVIGNLG
ncbi:MAG: BMP family ABC transporter substrate-binding protein [Peptococcaceae bacterium]|jgi:basic membrane protein A|nr:BMP family ABC transporter substrate-binding protein [Peptococcaceae bacterium]